MTAQDRKAWSAADYGENARFVADLAGPAMLDLLAAKPGEEILDLGCGDGALTLKIAQSGAHVIGVDGDADMVRAAKDLGLDAQQMDGQALRFDQDFDAVFTNAALHWMMGPEDVTSGVYAALKPGGRYVGEFGGFGNITGIQTAARAAMHAAGYDMPAGLPHYYPTADGFKALLEDKGFEKVDTQLIPRPTPLPTGMMGWLKTFGDSLLPGVPKAEHPAMFDLICALLEPSLRTPAGDWIADYIRLRFTAHKPAA